MTPGAILEGLWAAAVEAVFPTTCYLCGQTPPGWPPPRSGLCEECRASLPVCREPVCSRCGVELVSERDTCTRCRGADFAFERCVAIHPYLGSVRDLVHLYKALGRRRLSLAFAESLARAYRCQWRGLPVVPVPGRREVWRARGWEHVDELARHLDRRYGVPVVRCMTRASRAAQKALDLEGRRANLRGTIGVREGRVPAQAVLLDDIITTGSTLSECARVLREAGCERVFALTVAVDE